MGKASEFILRDGVTPVLFVAPYASSFAKLVESYATDEKLQVIECETALEAVPVLRASERGVVIAHASSQEHVIKLITFMKILRENARKYDLKIIVTIKFDPRTPDRT